MQVRMSGNLLNTIPWGGEQRGLWGHMGLFKDKVCFEASGQLLRRPGGLHYLKKEPATSRGVVSKHPN